METERPEVTFDELGERYHNALSALPVGRYVLAAGSAVEGSEGWIGDMLGGLVVLALGMALILIGVLLLLVHLVVNSVANGLRVCLAHRATGALYALIVVVAIVSLSVLISSPLPLSIAAMLVALAAASLMTESLAAAEPPSADSSESYGIAATGSGYGIRADRSPKPDHAPTTLETSVTGSAG